MESQEHLRLIGTNTALEEKKVVFITLDLFKVFFLETQIYPNITSTFQNGLQSHFQNHHLLPLALNFVHRISTVIGKSQKFQGAKFWTVCGADTMLSQKILHKMLRIYSYSPCEYKSQSTSIQSIASQCQLAVRSLHIG